MERHHIEGAAHALEKRRYEEASTLLEALSRERQALEDPSHYALSVDRDAPALKAICDQFLTSEVELVHVARVVQVLLPGKDTLSVGEPHVLSLEARGRLRSVASRFKHVLLSALPRQNQFLYSYDVTGRVRVACSDPGAFVRSVFQFLNTHTLDAALRRMTAPHGAMLTQLLDVQRCVAVAESTLGITVEAFLQGTRHIRLRVPSNARVTHPADITKDRTFVRHVGAEVMKQLVTLLGELLARHRQPLVWFPNPLLPAIPRTLSPEPELPRVCPRTTRFWEDLPWEAHYNLQRLGDAPKERVFLGYDPAGLDAVCVDRESVHAHVHVVGATRSGKTAAALAPLLVQVIRGSDEPSGAPPPVLILDPKGDRALFHTARIEAAKRGQRFRAFTTNRAFASEHFDVFGSFGGIADDPVHLAGILAQALDLYHGPGYGQAHFGKANREELVHVLSKALRGMEGVSSLTFQKLVKALGQMKSVIASEAANTLIPLGSEMLGERLAAPQSGDREAVIDMQRVVEAREVVYVWAPSLSTTASMDVARLFLFAFLAVIEQRSDHGKHRQCYTFLDEFQEILSFNVGRVMNVAAGKGLSLILANQSLADLRVGGVDLRDQVVTNANIRMFFSTAARADLEEILELSGERRDYLKRFTTSEARTTGTSRSETSSQTDSVGRSASVGRGFQQSWSHFYGTSSSSKGGSGSSSGTSVGGGSSQSFAEGTSSSQATGRATTTGTQESEQHGKSDGLSEVILPGLDKNGILLQSSKHIACFVRVGKDGAATQFDGRIRPVQALHIMDRREYGERQRQGWAPQVQQSPVSRPPAKAQPAQAAPPSRRPRPQEDHPQRAERGKMLERFVVDHEHFW